MATTDDSLGLSLVAGRRAFPYPSPFFDIQNTKNPPHVKALFRYCLFYATTHPIVSAAIWRMSSYPVTKIILRHRNDRLKAEWEEVLNENIRLRSFLVKINLDYLTYGNVFVTPHFPYRRYLVCSRETGKDDRGDPIICQKRVEIRKAKQFQIVVRAGRVTIEAFCENCNRSTTHKVLDHPIKDARKINLIRLNPERVDIDYVEVTGTRKYNYTMSGKMKRQIQQKDMDVLEVVPWMFVEAAFLPGNRRVTLAPDRVYHFERPSVTSDNPQWGTPLIMSVLKLLYLSQVLIKAREAIAHEHIVPLRVLYPAPNQIVDPAQDLNLDSWKRRLEGEIKKWRQDPNYIPIMPIAVGTAFIGGDANALSVAKEISELQRDVIAGLMVPLEFVYGGLSFSGSSISLRMLENDFINLREDDLRFVNSFLVPMLSKFLGLRRIEVAFSELRTADDVQRQQLYLTLAQQGYMSLTRLLEDIGIDPDEEFKTMAKEIDESVSKIMVQKARAQAEAQGEMNLESLTWQIKGQIKSLIEQGQLEQRLILEGMDPSLTQDAQAQLVARGAFNLPSGQYSEGGGSPAAGGGGGNGTGEGTDAREILTLFGSQLLKMPQGERGKVLENIKQQSPAVGTSLEEMMAQLTYGSGGGGAQGGVDMRPAAKQKPERRSTSQTAPSKNK